MSPKPLDNLSMEETVLLPLPMPPVNPMVRTEGLVFIKIGFVQRKDFVYTSQCKHFSRPEIYSLKKLVNWGSVGFVLVT